MDLTHTFTVPASVEDTWAAFNDIESVAGCFPGAVVTSVEGDTFEGSCKVKLGPIALVYKGSGTFLEKDESAHRFRIEAKGKDKRGNGTAGAKVTATLTSNGESTDVEVVTDLAITGKPAQFGRGVMQDVSDKLLKQFVTCLEQKVVGPADDPAPVPEAAPEAAEAAPPAAATEAPEPGAGPGAGAASLPPSPETPTPASQPDSRPAAQPASRPASAGRQEEAGGDDALDLGATVLPVLAKAYWRQALAVAVGLLVLRSLVRRRSR